MHLDDVIRICILVAVPELRFKGLARQQVVKAANAAKEADPH
jgi:hypothetical protein